MFDEYSWALVGLGALGIWWLWHRVEKKRQNRQAEDFTNTILGTGWEKRAEQFEQGSVEFARWQRQEKLRKFQEQQKRDNIVKLKSQGLIKDDPS